MTDVVPDMRTLWQGLSIARAEELGIPMSWRQWLGGACAPRSAFPAEDVVLQRVGPLSLTATEARTPNFNFDESPNRGPGLTVRHQLPAEPLTSVDLRLRGVGGRQASQSGQQTVFQVPKDGSG